METVAKRGRPPKVVPVDPTSADVKFVEVVIEKKYVPHLCYEVDGDHAFLVRDETTNKPILQKDVKVGIAQDKFGRAYDVYREIFNPLHPGTTVELPRDEALAALKSGAASMTSRSLD